ncbi:TetR/AcrR family transcriptional regulator [Streptomyces sp. NPDC006711]|uniref:TetR/AcrR family transcriptional regulator n=1 Tax=unclassified Streptomyces TaxID=2593676 RepID=UPI0033EF9F34
MSPRADAARNRSAVLQAADEVFVEHGVAASTEEIARRAGVGIGTVFRHFPTKEVLLKAVYEQRIEHLAGRALTAGTDDASPTWFRDFFTDAAIASPEKLILADALGDLRMDADPEAMGRLRSAVGGLLRRAQVAGIVRQDVSFDDLIALLIAAGRAAQVTADARTRTRLIDVILDGLEPRR